MTNAERQANYRNRQKGKDRQSVPLHRFEKLETEEDWRNAMVDPFGERAK